MPGGSGTKLLDFSQLTGRWALSQAHRGALDKIMVFKGAGANPVEEDKPSAASETWLHSELTEDFLGAAELGHIDHFKSLPAIGDFSTAPENINDGNTASDAVAKAVNQYAEVSFYIGVTGKEVKIPVWLKKWRQFGDGYNNEDGRWKIQYWNLVTNAWTDWVTNIPTRNATSWSAFATETLILTTKIRLVCTTVDSAATGESGIGELEVVYE